MRRIAVFLASAALILSLLPAEAFARGFGGGGFGGGGFRGGGFGGGGFRGFGGGGFRSFGAAVSAALVAADFETLAVAGFAAYPGLAACVSTAANWVTSAVLVA